MIRKIETFYPINKFETDYTAETLQKLPCGLHRASLADAPELMPELADLFMSAPVFDPEDPEDYEVDVKIHMLMDKQYPCIPNWHCDNIPRDSNGTLDYDRAFALNAGGQENMLFWVSGEPLTQFLKHSEVIDHAIRDHGHLSDVLEEKEFRRIPEQTWCSIPTTAPHRGRRHIGKTTWRVFVRITPSYILPKRPVLSEIRRHAQVYLPVDFHW